MKKAPSSLQLVTAYAIVYVVWGSTYFFIREALEGFPPLMLGASRFILAGLIMLAWSLFQREEHIFDRRSVARAAFSGVLLLFVANGSVIVTEQYLPSGLVAIVVSATPIWFVLFDRPAWQQNLRSPAGMIGLLTGFAGMMLLFYEQLSVTGTISAEVLGLLLLAPISWAAGSLVAKYYPGKASATTASAWQMLSAGLVFTCLLPLSNQTGHFSWGAVPAAAWFSLFYLVLFGSIAGFSAYVWLLRVHPTTKVSTYAYVNPVVAVLIGVFIGQEAISGWQLTGLFIILGSVLLVNLNKQSSQAGH